MSSSTSASPVALAYDEEAFPSGGLLPKSETEVAAFLAAHPDYDGRDVVVAIFDTGCDPGASGLARTSTGAHKFVDLIDATGSGDVSTATVVEAKPDADGITRFVSPVSGRSISMPASISNPRGVWQVGVKRAFEIYPNPLVDRMKRERRKVWDEAQRRLEQELARRLASWDEDAAKATAAGVSSPTNGVSAEPSSYPSTFTAKDKADLKARIEQVKAASTKFEDPGPVFDVIAWHTGTPAAVVDPSVDRERGWYAAVDSTCTGDFTNAKPLTNWRDVPEYATFSGVDLMNFTVNIYGGGRIVSLVTTAGSHGTHVAGIVGAFAGDDDVSSPHNGIAPGARMVSIKIGDSRLGSMETGVGLVRGLIEAIRLKVDIINMSYGESSSIPNSGRISELIRSAVFDHGIIFVSSAGNNGPALSTAGSPGGTDNGVISVGAYVSPSMSLACYSSRQAVRENQYSWSSRGPTIDGGAGVTVSACGGAVTSVCNWQLQKSQLMNGTSMSSPACAGGIALLCSGLKARGIRYTPQRVKAAIENTARSVDRLDPLTLGCGLLQVSAAFDHLVANADRPELDLFYRVTLPALNMRGIYLRDAVDSSKAFEATVQVEPVFRDQRIVDQTDSAPTDAATPVGLAHPHNWALNKSRIEFEQKIALVSTVDYIDAPSHLLLMHGGRAFTLVVHGERLAPGMHFTEILGYDTAYPQSEWASRGPLFRVPVTVLKPEDPVAAHKSLAAAQSKTGGAAVDAFAPGVVYKFANLACDAGGPVHRRFVTVPEGATFVDFSVTAHSFKPAEGAEADAAADPSRSFMFHALYLQPEHAYSDHEVNSFFSLTGESPRKDLRMNVRGGQTLEVCVTQYWSSLGPCAVDVEVSFQGLVIDNAEEIVLDASDAFHPVSFRSTLRTTKVSPSATLKTWHTVVKPSSAVIAPLTKERDFLVVGSKLISSLLLTYQFELKEDSSCVKVRAPPLNDRLYESVYESQLTQIFDANKRFLFATDAFESGKPLKQGKYTARILVRHDDTALLERLKDLAVVVEIGIKDVTVPVYASYTTAVADAAKYPTNKSLKAGKSAVCYLGVPDAKSFPSFAKPGDWASGQVVMVKNEGLSEKGGAVKLRVYAPAAAAPAEKAAASATTTTTSKKDAPKSDKPAEGEQDPSFPKLEQKDPNSSPQPSPPTVTGGAASPLPVSPSSAPVASAPSSLAIELRDLTLAHLSKLKSSGDASSKQEALSDILPPLLVQFPSHLPLLFLALRFSHEVAADRDARAQVWSQADVILTQHIDQQALLAHFGRIIEKDDTVGQALRKEKEEVRRIVVRVLQVKLELAMTKIRGFKAALRAVEYQPAARKELDGPDESSQETFAQSLSSLSDVWTEIGQWVDVHSKEAKAQFASYHAFQPKVARHYGQMMKLINTDIAAATDAVTQAKLAQERVDLVHFLAAQEDQLYRHLARHYQDAAIIQFPKEYTLF